MKRLSILTTILLLTGAMLRAEPPGTPEQQLAATLKKMKAQQAEIATNQTKIEERLTVVADQMRLARVFSSRSGH